MSNHRVHPIPDTLTALQGIQESLAEAQSQNPLAPAWLLMPSALVPEWRRYQGSCLNVRAGTFIHISQWLLDQKGRPPVILSGAKRQRFLQLLIQRVHDHTPLQVLGDCVHLSGFSRHLGLWLEEMKQQEISLSRFQVYAEESQDPREQDLALLYQAYAEHLQSSSWLDEPGAMVQACQVLQEEDRSWLSLAFVGIAGHVQFSPLQKHLIRSLAACTPTSRIFLPVSSDCEDLTAEIAGDLGFACADAASGSTRRPPPVPHQMEAPSQEQEVRGVLRAIKRLWVVEEVPVANISLCVSRMDSYAPLLDAVAEEYGLPLDLSVSLSSHPLFVILRQVLTLFPDLPWRQGWQVLRSPFLHQSLLTAAELDTAYRLTAACRVIQGQDQWDAPFTQDYDWRQAGRHLQDLEEADLQDLHARLQALWTALKPRDGQLYWDWIHDLVAETSSHPVQLVIPDTLADSERQAGQYVLDTLRQVVAELQAEAKRLPFASESEARHYLLQRLSDVKYRKQKRDGAIRVLAFTESWMLPSEHLFVLGMNERSLPHTPNAGPFYAWPERSGHALPLQNHDFRIDRLRWAVLQANCRTALHLSRPTDVADMPSTAPSPYWNLEASCTQMERLSVPHSVEAASPSELLQALLRDSPAVYPASLQAPIDKARTLADITDLRYSYSAPGIYEGILRTGEIGRDLQGQFGPNHAWSPTALGEYARCPMGFLVKHVLQLEPPPTPTPGLDTRIRGLLLHAILQELYQWIRDEQVPMVESQWEHIRNYLERICAEQWSRAGWRYLFQPYALARFELRELKLYAQWCIRNDLAESPDQVEWEPYALEWNIAGEGIVITEGVDRPFRLRGIVDRLDQNREGQMRVIDYKTRKAFYSGRELELALTNQAVLYRMAATEAGYEVQECGYRMLLHTEDGKLRNIPKDDVATAMIQRIQRHQNAIRAGHFPNAPADLEESGRKCTGYCELADFCQPTYSSQRKATQGK